MKEAKKKADAGRWMRMVVLAALVMVAIIMWRSLGKQENTQPSAPTATQMPAAQKNEREKRENAFEKNTAALQALLESGAADQATQEMAAQKLTELIAEHRHEIGLEIALQEAGYENAVVLMQHGAVTVMVPQERLSESSSAQILELCVVHAGVGAENVRVMGILGTGR